MCWQIAIPLLLAGVSGAGTIASNNASRRSQEDQNNQINANNRRLEQQYDYNRTQAEQARAALEHEAKVAYDEQQKLALEKQARLQRELPQMEAPQQQLAQEEAAANRLQTFDLNQLTEDATPIGMTGSGELPAIVQNSLQTNTAQTDANSRQLAAMLANLHSLGDVQQDTRQGFRNLGRDVTELGETAQIAGQNRGSKIGALNRSISDALTRQYETLPVNVKPGTSPIGDLLTGLGDIGMNAYFMRTPKPKLKSPFQSPVGFPIG